MGLPLRVRSRLAEVAAVTAGVTRTADDFAAMPKSAALGQMETSANFGAKLSYPHANRSPTLSGTNAVIRRLRAMDEAAWVNGRWHHDVIMGLVDREFR
jgi:hypothetical protein